MAKGLQQVERLPALPARPADGHKGTFGTVVVVGGSETMIGAPALCASAALRSGAGLVKVAAPGEVLAFILTVEPCATGIQLGRDAGASAAAIDEAAPLDGARAVLAVGPGLGKSKAAGELVAKLLRGGRAMVLDADGLNHAAAMSGAVKRSQRAGSLVMTPHPGEFARLAKQLGVKESGTDARTREGGAVKLAKAWGAVVVLKGRRTVVAEGGKIARVYVNQTGNPALATAGSGDVLTGLIAGLMAQGMSGFDAAALGVHLHGAAGDLWSSRLGESGMTARELAELLPEVISRQRLGVAGG